MGRPYRLVAAVTLPQGPGGLAATPQPPAGGAGESSDGGSGGGEGGRVLSTSSMDGHESEAVPLRLADGGGTALIGVDGFLNVAPGRGRYAAALTVHAGASPADDLLHLQAACSSSTGGSGSVSSSSGSGGGSGAACLVEAPVVIELRRDGVALPAALLLAAAAGGAGRALVVLDLLRQAED